MTERLDPHLFGEGAHTQLHPFIISGVSALYRAAMQGTVDVKTRMFGEWQSGTSTGYRVEQRTDITHHAALGPRTLVVTAGLPSERPDRGYADTIFTPEQVRSGITVVSSYGVGRLDPRAYISGLFSAEVPSEKLLSGRAFENERQVITPQEQYGVVTHALLVQLVGVIAHRYADLTPPQAVKAFVKEMAEHNDEINARELAGLLDMSKPDNTNPATYEMFVSHYRYDRMRRGEDPVQDTRTDLIASGNYLHLPLQSLGISLADAMASPDSMPSPLAITPE